MTEEQRNRGTEEQRTEEQSREEHRGHRRTEHRGTEQRGTEEFTKEDPEEDIDSGGSRGKQAGIKRESKGWCV